MDDKLAKALTHHLGFLGYEVRPTQGDGWVLAVHPVRLDFMFRPFELGVRLYCALFLGKRVDEDAWHTFLNRANDASFLARFALARDEDGDFVVRARTLLPGKYDRRTFGLLLDAWQEDLAQLRDGAPQARADGDEAEEDGEAEKETARVN